jgi:uncharacterized protein
MKEKQNIIPVFLSMLLILVFIVSCSSKSSVTADTTIGATTSNISVETTQATQVKQTVETSIKYPAPTGFVNDFAGVFTEDEKSQMESYLKDFEKKTTVQIAVVTVKSLEGLTLEKYASELFNTWGIGQAGKDNGILLLIPMAERQLRITVGNGLENTITDAVASQIMNEVIFPYFKESKIGQGCYEGVKAIAEKISADQ